MKLKDVIKNVEGLSVHGNSDIEITNITSSAKKLSKSLWIP